MCLGPGPIPNGAEIARCTTKEVHKVALGPSATEADAHTFASLRSLQPRVLPFVLSRAALLTRPRPAQPLLLTADSAGSSVFLSPIGVTIAAARPCLFIECVSAKNACPAYGGIKRTVWALSTKSPVRQVALFRYKWGVKCAAKC